MPCPDACTFANATFRKAPSGDAAGLTPDASEPQARLPVAGQSATQFAATGSVQMQFPAVRIHRRVFDSAVFGGRLQLPAAFRNMFAYSRNRLAV